MSLEEVSGGREKSPGWKTQLRWELPLLDPNDPLLPFDVSTY